jgi:hypothetical protein
MADGIAPNAGVVTLVWLWGAYTVSFEIILMWFSFRLRSSQEGARAQNLKAAA